MDLGKTGNTAVLMLAGIIPLLRSTHEIILHTAKEPLSSLLKTAAITLPLFVLIGYAFTKLSKDYNWELGDSHFIVILLIAGLSTFLIGGAAAVGFGFTAEKFTAFTVFMIFARVSISFLFFKDAIENIVSNKNNRIENFSKLTLCAY